MTTAELIEMTRKKGDEPLKEQIVRGHGAVVLRGGTAPVEFFDQRKHADAWVKHVYGMSAWEAGKQLGLVVQSLYHLKPAANHAIVYDGSGDYSAMTLCNDNHVETYQKAGYGAISAADDANSMIFFNLSSSFYENDNDYMEASGGPGRSVLNANLTLIGLKQVTRWRWADFPQANGGGYFTMTVPVWRWNGAG